MKYYRGVLKVVQPSMHGPLLHVETDLDFIGVYASNPNPYRNGDYGDFVGINLANMTSSGYKPKNHAGQRVIVSAKDHTGSLLDEYGSETDDLWAVPALVDEEELEELSKKWNGWAKPGDPQGLGDNPFGMGNSIKILSLIVVTQENRSQLGDKKSTFVLNRFHLLVDMERTTEEEIVRVLGRYYSQDPKEFHIGPQSLGHPDNPVPAGMQGYTYKSKAGLIIVGADKLIYFPKKTLLGDDGAAIALSGGTTVTGETLFNQGFNPVTLSMRGHEAYPILEKNTPLGRQKTKIDGNGCLITRIAGYISNYTEGQWSDDLY